MRTLLFAALALLAGCGGSSTSGGSESTGGTSAAGSSGGTSDGPPSGTATLSGDSAFEVKTAFFRWDHGGDGGVITENAMISLADVAATCAEFTEGLNLHYSTLRVFGLNPRVTGGTVEVGDYDDSADPFANGAHFAGYYGVTQGEAAFPHLVGLKVSLTAVANDAIAGSFTATWMGGGAPLTGTFSVPLCGPSP